KLERQPVAVAQIAEGTDRLLRQVSIGHQANCQEIAPGQGLVVAWQNNLIPLPGVNRQREIIIWLQFAPSQFVAKILPAALAQQLTTASLRWIECAADRPAATVAPYRQQQRRHGVCDLGRVSGVVVQRKAQPRLKGGMVEMAIG